MNRKEKKKLFVATGAFSCGKTTTLQCLKDNYNISFHGEAHMNVLKRLGSVADGHPYDESFKKIPDPGHFCPICNGLEFAKMVLEEQLLIEKNAKEFDFIERGFLDPIEYYLRYSKKDLFPEEISKDNYSDYRAVFLFDVINEVQEPRWGKSKAERIKDAYYINERLYNMYKNEGFEVYVVSKNNVKKRAAFINKVINELK